MEEVAFEQLSERKAGFRKGEDLGEATLTQENAPSKGEKGGHAHLWTGGWHGQGRVGHKFHTRRAVEGFRAGEKNNVRRYVW